MPETKVCIECGGTKPLDDFFRNATGTLGRNSYCKPCERARKRQWYRRHVPDMPWVAKERDRLILKLVRRDGMNCALCGFGLDFAPGKLHIDHRHPKALGGTDNPGNLQLTHKSCNLSKWARPLEEWAGRLKDQLLARQFEESP